jgi:transcription elongation factor Elf1
VKKALASLALCALISVGLSACNEPSTVACSVTAGSQLSCSSGGITGTISIPADVAAVVGIVAPIVAPATFGVARAIVPATVSCTVDTKSEIATCTNSATGKSASFPVPPSAVHTASP